MIVVTEIFEVIVSVTDVVVKEYVTDFAGVMPYMVLQGSLIVVVVGFAERTEVTKKRNELSCSNDMNGIILTLDLTSVTEIQVGKSLLLDQKKRKNE